MNDQQFTLVWRRFKARDEDQFETLTEAVEGAAAMLRGDDAWPELIRRGETILWKQVGPMKTEKSLRAFAVDNGISIP